MNNMNTDGKSRRRFLHDVGFAAMGIPLLSSLSSNDSLYNEEKRQKIKEGKEPGKLGIAVVGLGTYGTLVSTALEQTNHCYLARIASGTPSKIAKWKTK